MKSKLFSGRGESLPLRATLSSSSSNIFGGDSPSLSSALGFERVPAPENEDESVAMMGGSAPQTPWDLSQFSSRVDGFSLVLTGRCRKMEGLDRRIGQRRDATRAPTQARSGWRPSGRLLVCSPPRRRPRRLHREADLPFLRMRLRDDRPLEGVPVSDEHNLFDAPCQCRVDQRTV
jgi:hypothetical protein